MFDKPVTVHLSLCGKTGTIVSQGHADAPLARVEFNDELLFEIAINFGALRQTLNSAGQILQVTSQPGREGAFFSGFPQFFEVRAIARAFAAPEWYRPG